MGEIRKVGETYYIEFYARGLMYSQVAGTDEESAKKLLQEVEAKIAQGEALTIVREIDLEIFFDRFLNYAQDKYSLKSLERFTSTWNHLKTFLQGSYPNVTKLSHLTPSVIESYKIHLVKTTKPKVTNLTLLLLREILEYGIKIGFINDNPSLHINLLKLAPSKEREGGRANLAKDLFRRHVSLEKIYGILKLNDVAQILYWSNDIPLRRDEVYF